MKTEVKTKIVDLYKENTPIIEIIKETGYCRQTIYDTLKLNGININRQGSGSIKIKTSDYPEIINLYQNGVTTTVIANKFGVNHDTIGRLLKILKIELRVTNRLYELNEDYFDNINSPEKAYAFGFIIADGCVQESSLAIDIKYSDKYLLEFIGNQIYTNKDYKITDYDNKRMSRLGVHSRHMINSLEKLGCIPNKSRDLKFATIPQGDLFWHFLRGLFDGDGCFHVSIAKNRYTPHQYFQICMHNNLSTIIKKELIKYGFNGRVYQHPTSDQTRYLYITKKDEIVRLYDLIYKDDCFSLKRKKDKWTKRKSEIVSDRKHTV